MVSSPVFCRLCYATNQDAGKTVAVKAGKKTGRKSNESQGLKKVRKYCIKVY